MSAQFPQSPGNNTITSLSAMDEIQAQLYKTGFGTRNDYEFHPGVCILPLAEEPPTDPTELASWSPVVVLRLHAPYRERRYSTTTVKTNNPPVTQAPVDTGAFVFTGGTMSLTMRMNSTQANFDWNVVTDYFFVEDCVSRPADGLVLGIPPFTYNVQAENAQGGGGLAPSLGAISGAGPDALIGYAMGEAADLNGTWGYNTPSFYPGDFFNSNLANAGPPTNGQPVGGGYSDQDDGKEGG